MDAPVDPEPKGPPWAAEALRLRSQLTLKEIGARLGVSRERVRQVLDLNGVKGTREKNPGNEDFVTPYSIEHRGLATAKLIRQWVAAGLVRINDAGLVHELDVLNHIVELMERQCTGPECQNPVASVSKRTVRCASCSADAKKYYYPFMNTDQKGAHLAHQYTYQKRRQERSRTSER